MDFVVKNELQLKYAGIPERIIAMALESVDFSVDKAKQILNIVVEENNQVVAVKEGDQDETEAPTTKESKRYWTCFSVSKNYYFIFQPL